MSDNEQRPAQRWTLGPFVVTMPALVALERLAHSQSLFARFGADQRRLEGLGAALT